MARVSALTLSIVWLCLAGALAQSTSSLQVSTSHEPEQVQIGAPLHYEIALKGPEGVTVPDVQLPEQLGDFEVLDKKTSEDGNSKGSGFSRLISLKLASYEAGERSIPPIAIPYKELGGESATARTTTTTIQVASAVAAARANGESVELRPPEPPMRWPGVNWRAWVWWAAGGVVAAALALWLWRRRKRRRAAAGVEDFPVESLLEPDEEALRALAEVEMQDLARRVDAKAYYSRLSEILRRYMTGRYGFDAFEMTSGELLERASRLNWSSDLFRLLNEDASETDGVKFARYAPSLSQRLQALERVRRIVLETRPAPIEEPDAAVSTPEAAHA